MNWSFCIVVFFNFLVLFLTIITNYFLTPSEKIQTTQLELYANFPSIIHSRERERSSKNSNLIDIFFLFNLRYLYYTVYFVGNLIFFLFLFHFRFNCCKHIKKQKLLYRENSENWIGRQAIIGFGSTCFSLFVFLCFHPPNLSVCMHSTYELNRHCWATYCLFYHSPYTISYSERERCEPFAFIRTVNQ